MSTPTIHVLRRRNWRFAGDHLVLLPGHVRLQSFTDADEAAKVCREKDQAIRTRVNPFRCGGPSLRNQTSLDAGRLRDWALDQGLTPPEGDEWAAWWDEQHPQMTELQRDAMWKALDRLSFYEVVEQPERALVYIAVAVNWQYNDQAFVADAVPASGAVRPRTTSPSTRRWTRPRDAAAALDGGSAEVADQDRGVGVPLHGGSSMGWPASRSAFVTRTSPFSLMIPSSTI